MIILLTFLIGMSAYTLLIALEWVRIQFRVAHEAFSRPLAVFQREARPYMKRVGKGTPL